MWHCPVENDTDIRKKGEKVNYIIIKQSNATKPTHVYCQRLHEHLHPLQVWLNKPNVGRRLGLTKLQDQLNPRGKEKELKPTTPVTNTGC